MRARPSWQCTTVRAMSRARGAGRALLPDAGGLTRVRAMRRRFWLTWAVIGGVLAAPTDLARAQVELPLPSFGQRPPARPAPPPAAVQPPRPTPPAATTVRPGPTPPQAPSTTTAPGAAPTDPNAPPPAAGPPPPYQTQLERLAELLGSLHYLRALCGADEGQSWRVKMSDLLAAENPAADDRKRMVEAFNRGYRSLAEVHRQCTPVAVEMVERAMAEAAKTARDIATRFGR